MLETHSTLVAFSAGGQILETQENQTLLDLVKVAPALSPADLLKLATFFQEHATNIPLANHLVLTALSMEVTDPQVQKALSNANIPGETNLSPNDVWDWAEDLLDGGADENSEGSSSLSIKSVPFFGVGLLVETSGGKSFIIGVGPV